MKRVCVSFLVIAALGFGLFLDGGPWKSWAQEKAASRFTAPEFKILMEQLAQGWSKQDVDQAMACFAEDAVYMEPPDIQLFVGHAQLRPYFGALRPGTYMRWHNVWFDESRQLGAGEFTFGVEGRDSATHGVAVVELQNGRIAFWREFQQRGPASRKRFLSPEGKEWKWTGKNYP